MYGDTECNDLAILFKASSPRFFCFLKLTVFQLFMYSCHRHGRLCDYRSTLFFYFAKSNSFPTLVDLIFPLILSIHVTLILSYPHIFTFISTHPLSFLQMRWFII